MAESLAPYGASRYVGEGLPWAMRGVYLAVGALLSLGLGIACDGESSGETDEGKACTEIACTSSLVITLQHELALAGGGYLLEMDTPLHEIRCSIPAAETGSDSCFGFRFSDVEWDAESITITLTEPFFDTDLNPSAEPFESVDVRIEMGGALVAGATIAVDGGDLIQPNGPDCAPECWQAVGSADLRAG